MSIVGKSLTLSSLVLSLTAGTVEGLPTCGWVHRLADRWAFQARNRGQRALDMYERDLKTDGDHERAIRHIANAFFDEGLGAVEARRWKWQK